MPCNRTARGDEPISASRGQEPGLGAIGQQRIQRLPGMPPERWIPASLWDVAAGARRVNGAAPVWRHRILPRAW
jgi:hypothetical protein